MTAPRNKGGRPKGIRKASYAAALQFRIIESALYGTNNYAATRLAIDIISAFNGYIANYGLSPLPVEGLVPLVDTATRLLAKNQVRNKARNAPGVTLLASNDALVDYIARLPVPDSNKYQH